VTKVLGLDIGGTRTRARLARDGEVLAEAQAGSASLTAAGREQAEAALTVLLGQLSVDEASLDAVCVGSAGSGSGDARAFLQARLAPLTRQGTVVVVNDVELVLPAAGVGDGIAVVAGTGSNCVGRYAGLSRAAGGLGYLLGDEGSGYWIVKEAIREVLSRHDDEAPPGPLSRDLLHAADCPDQRTLLQRFYDDPRPDVWAAHVPAVLATDDPFAAGIAGRAAKALAGLAATCSRRLSAPPGLPVVLAGGLLTGHAALAERTRDHIQRLLPGAPVQTLSRPPVAGAVALAHAAAAAAR
jgi:N-acetylglucosamine kinase-like BadF-type ATPase